MQYIKIKDAIIEQIDSGLLTPRQKLPAERKLAEMFDTTRVTLREALSVLEAEGRIFREDRRGWFISPAPFKYDLTSTSDFHVMALDQGRKPDTEVVLAKSMLASKEAATLLDLPPFSDVYCVERVRHLEERPVVYVRHFIKQIPFPGLLEHDLGFSMAEIYEKNYGVACQKSRYKIRMISLIGEMAQALNATPGTPALLVERYNYSADGALIECSLEYWRHDAMCIESISELL
ncbi:UTRA domain-containing protein [Vibrio sp. HN007]|uniref:UTRA domain-containing protein n=1 Tax=Vibrio iocasae TaxID=3098914 RepID=UPI0035D4C590